MFMGSIRNRFIFRIAFIVIPAEAGIQIAIAPGYAALGTKRERKEIIHYGEEEIHIFSLD